MAAVVAVQHTVAIEDEGDVTIRAPQRDPACTAVERRCDTASIEQKDCLAAALGDRAELRKKRRRQRIPGLATKVDDADGWKRTAEPRAELDPLEPLPTLRAWSRAAEHRHRLLERRA